MRRTFTRCLALLLAALLAATTAPAEETGGGESLWPLLEAQQQASGGFMQELYSEEGDLLERSSGRYAVLRPGYFRWHIDYPDRQEIIVSDGTLWHYDIDLAAATRRDTFVEGQFTPLELLAGNTPDLRERFVVELLGVEHYRLQPIFAQAGFSSVDIRWREGEIVAMEIRDRSGQEIRLALTPEEAEVPLSPEDFSFTPPEDAEVYIQNEAGL